MAKSLDETSSLLNETKRATEKYIADFMRWLSARYAIVEKEKVKEYYEYAAEYIADYKGEGMWGLEAADPTMCERAKGQKQILLRLFGKELFKDEEK